MLIIFPIITQSYDIFPIDFLSGTPSDFPMQHKQGKRPKARNMITWAKLWTILIYMLVFIDRFTV